MFHTLAAMKNNAGIGAYEPELRLSGEREVVADCDRIIAATAEEQEGLHYYYGAEKDRIAVIPCGVNLNLFKPVDGSTVRRDIGIDGRKLLLYVGRMEPVKGLECLLKSLSYFDEKDAPLLFVIGGDIRNYSHVHAFKEMATACGALNRVHFIGSTAHDKLPLYYSAADACIIPSYYESFGIVALEALACGTPVIATDVGTMSDIITTPLAGVILKDNHPRTLFNEITRFLNNGDRTGSAAESRRTAVAGYSWSAIADRLLAQYAALLHPSSCHALSRSTP
jgi:D-inositol-3-phosphate glycosyltransferase